MNLPNNIECVVSISKKCICMFPCFENKTKDLIEIEKKILLGIKIWTNYSHNPTFQAIKKYHTNS